MFASLLAFIVHGAELLIRQESVDCAIGHQTWMDHQLMTIRRSVPISVV